jgi:tetratricopeptide (TPR) repeat protein
LATAVNACRAVAEVRDRQKTPLAWAAAQNNLGSALFLLGKKARNPERLEAAVRAFENALEIYNQRQLYRLAAVTEKNLERAQDMIDWYAPDGIPIIELADTPVAALAARAGGINGAQPGRVRSGQAIEVIE